jgi:hypothetical protein
MKQHVVYFYGSTRIVSGHNSLKLESVRMRNQIVGFEGIDRNPELVKYGEVCLNKLNADGTRGETGTMYPKHITIVPFQYFYPEDLINRHLEDVITANEEYIKAESIGFPLMMLKQATADGHNRIGRDLDIFKVINREAEREFKANWCCFGHYYLYLLKKALSHKGYSSPGVDPEDKIGNLRNTLFSTQDGRRVEIYADAGI